MKGNKMLKKIIDFFEENDVKTRTQLRELLKENPIEGVNNVIVEGLFADYKNNPGKVTAQSLTLEQLLDKYGVVKRQLKTRPIINKAELERLVEVSSIQQLADYYGVCYLTMHRTIHKLGLGDKVKTGRPSVKVVIE